MKKTRQAPEARVYQRRWFNKPNRAEEHNLLSEKFTFLGKHKKRCCFLVECYFLRIPLYNSLFWDYITILCVNDTNQVLVTHKVQIGGFSSLFLNHFADRSCCSRRKNCYLVGKTPLPTGQGVELHKEKTGGFSPLFVDPGFTDRSFCTW